MASTKVKKSLSVRDMTLCAIFAALLAVCAWISVPTGGVPFTLQTFGIFLTLELLGGRRGTWAIGVYLLLGAMGLPVFAGFQGGAGALLGLTGGYIVGFLLTALAYWLLTALLGKAFWVRLAALILGLALCYAAGTAWFMAVYLRNGKTIALTAVLAKCVLPYLIPDGIKLALALPLGGTLRRCLKESFDPPEIISN